MSGLGFSITCVRLNRWKRASLTKPSLSLYRRKASQIWVSFASPVTFSENRKSVLTKTTPGPKSHRWTSASTFKFPPPERKSENPAFVARSPIKVIPGLSSTKAFTAASVTCHKQDSLTGKRCVWNGHDFNDRLRESCSGAHTCFLPETSRETRAGRIPRCPSSWRAMSDVNCLSSLMSRCCMNTTTGIIRTKNPTHLVKKRSYLLTCKTFSWPMTPSSWAVLISSLFSWCNVRERSRSFRPSRGVRLVMEVLERSRLSRRGREHTSTNPQS